MDKFFKHFGINLKKNSTDHVSSSSNIPQELNESTLALSKDKYCGWSALIDFPLKYNSRRNSEIAHRLASHDLDCNKFLVLAPDFNHEHQCREHIYLNSARPKVPRTRASICFDSFVSRVCLITFVNEMIKECDVFFRLQNYLTSIVILLI